MIDPLSPKKIEPVRLTPGTLTDRQVTGNAVGNQRSSEGDHAETRLLELSAAIAAEGPPVDHESVNELSTAIREGRYTIEPRALASAILGFAAAGDGR